MRLLATRQRYAHLKRVKSLTDEERATLTGELERVISRLKKTPSMERLAQQAKRVSMPPVNDASAKPAHRVFPRTDRYDSDWVLDHSMGPNVLWLTEWLCEAVSLNADMTVLDMGCGKAVSSIFVAKEFGCTVFANDLWISASENLKRIEEAGLKRKIYPIKSEARSLPYAHGAFDAILCVDAYIYFGTDDLYLNYFLEFLEPNGSLGIVVPGLVRDFDGGVPPRLEPFWSPGFWCFHTLDWWKHLWGRTGLVEITTADVMPDGWQWWLDGTRGKIDAMRRRMNKEGQTAEAIEQALQMWHTEVDMLEADGGESLALLRIVARKIPADDTAQP